MMDYNYDEHIIKSTEQRNKELGFCEHGLWPHENCRSCEQKKKGRKREMTKSETIGALSKALSQAQKEMKGAIKESSNPFFKSKYADLAAVWEACREPLTKNGLAVIQTLDSEGDNVVIETILTHESGEWIAGRVSIPPAKKDAQGYGAVISYMRRYSLSAIVGGHADDDDAETDRKEAEKKAVSQPKAKQPAKDIETPSESLTGRAEPLGVEELIDKMATASNAFELKARWTKYAPDMKLLTPEQYVKVVMAKDKRKTDLEEIKKAEETAI